MNKKLLSRLTVLVWLITILLSGCAVIATRDTEVLFYENNQIVKDYEKEKKELSNPQIDNDDGYCPLCEL